MSKIKTIKPLGFPWQTQDPFLFCAYHMDYFPEGNPQMGAKPEHLRGRNIGQDFQGKDGWSMYHGQSMPGFPFHPHRGFETITINKQGVVDHTDSLGAAGRFMAGDVQWMTAGRGVQHSEMFPLLHEDKENTLEIFQIWLNLPRVSKLVEPHFKMLWKEDIPVHTHTDENGKITQVDIVAGSIEGTKALEPTPDSWAANPDNAVGVYTVKMEANSTWTLPATLSAANRSIFFYQGDSIGIEGKQIGVKSIVEAKADEDIIIKNGDKEAYFLILEGKPIGEPVVQHGPFVMNTVEEIQQTMREYGRTQFGGWPWQAREVAHPRDKGRFALHADGSEEVK
ncbi:pirin family protein [Algoriphagus namhaensis]|uniref:Pirin family protein n=1 Tax=Algoriphagus namhaensis TaxID=915353 RepID=A0ABV8AU28_9BACT